MFYERQCVIATVALSLSWNTRRHIAVFQDHLRFTQGRCIKGEASGVELNDGLNDRERLVWSVIHHAEQARNASEVWCHLSFRILGSLKFSDEKLMALLGRETPKLITSSSYSADPALRYYVMMQFRWSGFLKGKSGSREGSRRREGGRRYSPRSM